MRDRRKGVEERSRYYRTITRCFFEHRGAPFFLSSKELDIVTTWEKMEIPLSVVLEGIRNSFSRAIERTKRRGKVRSLAFCHLSVLAAYELYKERHVGRRQHLKDEDNRRERMEKEVKAFLASFPQEIGYIKDIYRRVLKEAAGQKLDEEGLEMMEEEVEEHLLANVSSEVAEKIRKEVLKEYGIQDEGERARIFRIKLIKHLRDRFKLPHISLFYY